MYISARHNTYKLCLSVNGALTLSLQIERSQGTIRLQQLLRAQIRSPLIKQSLQGKLLRESILIICTKIALGNPGIISSAIGCSAICSSAIWHDRAISQKRVEYTYTVVGYNEYKGERVTPRCVEATSAI